VSGKSKLNPTPPHRPVMPTIPGQRLLLAVLVICIGLGGGLYAEEEAAKPDAKRPAKPGKTEQPPKSAAEPKDPVAEKFAELRKLYRREPAKAAKGLKQFIDAHPQSDWADDAQYWLALSLDRSRARRRDVIAAFKVVVDKYPESSYRDDALFAVAETLRRRARRAEDYDLAVKAYLDFIKRSPRSKRVPEAKLKIGEVYRRVNRDKEAAKYFQKVVTDHPNTGYARRATMRLATTYLRLKRTDDALAIYLKLLEKKDLPHASRVAVQLGMVDCYLAANDGLDKALAMCETIRREATEKKSLEDFTEYRTREKMANYYLNRKKHVQAEAEYEAYLERFGKSVGIWQAKMNIGTIRMAAGKLKEARELFDEIIRHHAEGSKKAPWYVSRAMYFKAYTWEKEKNPTEARRAYEDLAKRFPRNYYGRQAVGRVKAIDKKAAAERAAEAKKQAEKKPPKKPTEKN